jgi:ankyrin repeat protein
MFFVLPLMMNGMNRTLALSKKNNSLYQKTVTQRLCSSIMSNKLLDGARNSGFDALSAIKHTIPKNLKSNDTFDLMEKIVLRAIENKGVEHRYAKILRGLRDHLDPKSYKVGLALGQDMLHLAVDNNLEGVTDQLLICNKEWVNHRDIDGRIPLHYAKSSYTARHLLYSGSDVNAVDENHNTPLHFVHCDLVETLLDFGAQGDIQNTHAVYVPSCGLVSMTPLRKAVFDGDFGKVSAFAWRMPFDQQEGKILHDLAGRKYERTGRMIFSEIQKELYNAEKHWRTVFAEKCLE